MCVFVWWSWLLVFQEIANDLQSGKLLAWWWDLRAWGRTDLFCLLLGAGLPKSIFQLLCCQSLVRAGPTCGAGIATPVWSPSVIGLLPWFGALLDEVLFFCLVCLAGCLSALLCR